jgi:hypothetical protein
MDWTAPVNIYCERGDASFWAEPINALTNLSFIMAALLAARTMRRLDRRGLDLIVLIALAAMIGIGSFLFHTFATRWSALTDVIPIWTFVVLIVLSGLVRVGGIAPWRAVAGFAVVVLVLIGAFWLFGGGGGETAPGEAGTPPLNGSLAYAPAWLVMVGFAVLTTWRKHPVAGWEVAATLTFTLSLVFRTVDLMLCDAFPFGTHFMWHLLNGVMIWLLLEALLRAPPRKPV